KLTVSWSALWTSSAAGSVRTPGALGPARLNGCKLWGCLRSAVFFFIAIPGEVFIDDRATSLICLVANVARGLATDRRWLVVRAAKQDRRQFGDRRGCHRERQQDHSQ